MAITFPTDPGAQTPVNTFSPSSTPVANSANGNTYVWNGTAWTTQQANLEQYVNVAGDVMTGTLTVPTVDATTVDATTVDATTLNAGNIILPDNGGITFGATYGGSGTGTSKVLDDYETGTFTPTDASGNLTLDTAVGKYKKVGDLVVVTGSVKYPINSNSAAAKVGGLPYAPTTLGGGGSMYVVMNGNGTLAFRTENGTSNFLITYGDQQNASVTNANLSNATFQFFLVYHTD